jgi:Fe2+ or Zn2+ uptake regulation protein
LTILAAVDAAQRGTHLSAQHVFARARAVQPKLGFATVHRALARLTELGLIHKLDVPGAPCAVYEPAAEAHAHFRCTSCGRIDDLEFRLEPALLETLGARQGVLIDGAVTTFIGRCAACAPPG